MYILKLIFRYLIIKNKGSSWTTLLLIFIATLTGLSSAKPDYTGLEGPYCERQFPERRCCPGRQDDCSVPILGTLCYCDDFCSNRTSEADCCPDFYSHCQGSRSRGDNDAPAPIIKGGKREIRSRLFETIFLYIFSFYLRRMYLSRQKVSSWCQIQRELQLLVRIKKNKK